MKKKVVLEWILTICVSVILAIVIRSFFFANYEVEGKSMLPTVHDGNRLIVNKIDYAFRNPDRFELIVFHYSETQDFIKRVIGLPGDSLYYKDDILYINGKAEKEPYLKPFKKKLVSGQWTEDFTLKEKTGRETVPKGHVFVLGDNRLHSYDSRYFGFVPIDEVVGKVNLRYWPLDHFKIIP